jgi:hypothetical protein
LNAATINTRSLGENRNQKRIKSTRTSKRDRFNRNSATSARGTARGAQIVLGDLQVDAELARAVSALFGLEVHFLIETARDLAFQFFQMAIAPDFKLRWFDYH